MSCYSNSSISRRKVICSSFRNQLVQTYPSWWDFISSSSSRRFRMCPRLRHAQRRREELKLQILPPFFQTTILPRLPFHPHPPPSPFFPRLSASSHHQPSPPGDDLSLSSTDFPRFFLTAVHPSSNQPSPTLLVIAFLHERRSPLHFLFSHWSLGGIVSGWM